MRRIYVAGVIIILVVSLVVGSFLIGKRQSSGNPDDTTTQSNDFPLLAKRIFTDDPNDTIINFGSLRNDLGKYMEDNGIAGGVYFEYLPTGTSIRINGDSIDVGASLLKTPVAMELYKAAELGKLNLNSKVALKQEWLNDGYGTLYQKGAGYELTLRNAAEIMLGDSDNTALQAIAASYKGLVPPEDSPFTSLDVDVSQNPDDKSISISPRSYGSFLKCLYFSCYLNKEHSQELLTMLSKTSFNDRLVAGVGDGVTVAHKIGSFNDQVQSDCGIVYIPKRQYILCVMLDGPDSNQTNGHIAAISKLSYEFVKNQKP